MNRENRHRRFRSRSCTKKRRFRDHHEATKAIHLIKRVGAEMRAYECSLCEGWHLASKSPD